MACRKEIVQLLVAVNTIALVLGHGMLLDPASRNSAWRSFPNRPAQYTDNELNCGGFSVQWDKNNGKCGVCGDTYHDKTPKYVYPGKYAKDGFITKTYKEGQTITVKVKITSNHQGFFRFSVGKLVTRPITQDQLTHVLLQPDGSNTWQLHSSRNGDYHIKLVLPKGLTCDHCVIQWWWTVGNNWGCDEDGNCGVGLGKKQETFVNCADIRITPTGGSAPPTGATISPSPQKPSPQPSPTTQRPLTQGSSSQGPPTKGPPNHPATQAPSGGCKATVAYKRHPGMDQWCASNCAAGYCPSTHCECN